MRQLVEEVHSWVNQTDKRIIIGISGHGAAGKSTFAHDLKEVLTSDAVNLFITDPYITDSDFRKKTMLTYHYENQEHHYKMTACHPAAHHLSALERDIRKVRDGLGFCTMDTHYANSEWMAPEKRITIVEGMSAAFVDLQLFDLKIYFYTDGATEFHRRAKRDISDRGMEMDYLRQSHNERRIQYEVFMHPYHQQFDIVIKNSKDIEYVNPQCANFITCR